MIVNEYKIKLSQYNSNIVGRLSFLDEQGREEESALYSLDELTNIIQLWKVGHIVGSFAIGTDLAVDAVLRIE
jgi:hypothetical protein